MLARSAPAVPAISLKGTRPVSTTLSVKKSVSFRWKGNRLDLDVAQELFSSHQVDQGSRMLLDSLHHFPSATQGRAADFGCGYGVLGVAWQVAHPGWTMHYVDRDALAVAFSRHNLARIRPNLTGRATFAPDITLNPSESGYDLVLWNVPGKAGRQVLAGLLEVILDGLASGGVLAAVVVHPLADMFFDSNVRRDDVSVAYHNEGKDHTVIHLRRNASRVKKHDPFAAGVFDRSPAIFRAAGLLWAMTPVIGLPEYDSLNRATELAIRSMATHQVGGRVDAWAVVGSGVGHEAMAASILWPTATGSMFGRDALAIKSTQRALAGRVVVETHPAWGYKEVQEAARFDLVIVAIPTQALTDELGDLLDMARRMLRVGGRVVCHGRSTEIARLDRLLRSQPDWRSGKPIKMKGSAVVTAKITR